MYNKKTKELVLCFFVVHDMYYYFSSCGEFTGHTSAQAPQSIHSSALISYLLDPSEIQETGHSGSQAPQLTQSSLIK